MSNENRRSPRYNLSSIEVKIGDQVCEVADVSPTGILMKGLDSSMERGDTLTMTISVPLMSQIVPVQVDGFVVRNDDRGLAVDYVKPAITWPHVLKVLDAKEHKEG